MKRIELARIAPTIIIAAHRRLRRPIRAKLPTIRPTIPVRNLIPLSLTYISIELSVTRMWMSLSAISMNALCGVSDGVL